MALGLPVDTRDFGTAAEALHLLGMPRVRLLTNNPEKIRQLQQHGIDVAHRLPLTGFVTEHNLSHLTVKDRMLGHLNSTGSDVPDD